MRPVSFSIEKQGPGLARAGVLKAPHGIIKTPAFVAVGTKADVKGVDVARYGELGIQTLIANTYHLFLSGREVIEKAGGLHNFMGYQGPIMTDSGGFQVFSLGVGFGKKISKVVGEEEFARQQSLGVPPERGSRGLLGGEIRCVCRHGRATSFVSQMRSTGKARVATAFSGETCEAGKVASR